MTDQLRFFWIRKKIRNERAKFSERLSPMLNQIALFESPALNIYQVPAFEDNFIYFLEKNGEVAVVDPGEESPVLTVLQHYSFRLKSILITHHHRDHIGAVKSLLERFPDVKIHGGKQDSRISFAHNRWEEGDHFSLLDQAVHVWQMNGHTLGHIAYYLPERKAIFSGDVLFSLGCGKLFEGTAEQMWASLEKIRSLPEDVAIYGSHEYTLENAEFALWVDPENKDLQEMVKQAQGLRSEGKFTVPTLVKEEKRANPFLRPEFFAHRFSLENEPQWKVFKALREQKDRWDAGEFRSNRHRP